MWGGQWEFYVVAVTGLPMFDWFFTLVLLFGIASTMIGFLLSLASRAAD